MDWGTLLSGFIPVTAVFVAGGVVTLVRKKRVRTLDGTADMSDMTDFFFDKPANPRTRTPGSKGWTTKVDEQLAEHGEQIGEIHTLVISIADELPKIHAEVKEGRSAATRAATAAEAEVREQHRERTRVAEREARHDQD